MPTLTLHDVPLEVLAALEERARLDQRSVELEACAQLVELFTIRQVDSSDALPRASFGSQLMTFLNEPEHLDELGEHAFEVKRVATESNQMHPTKQLPTGCLDDTSNSYHKQFKRLAGDRVRAPRGRLFPGTWFHYDY